jgi:hypothetical protein
MRFHCCGGVVACRSRIWWARRFPCSSLLGAVSNVYGSRHDAHRAVLRVLKSAAGSLALLQRLRTKGPVLGQAYSTSIEDYIL